MMAILRGHFKIGLKDASNEIDVQTLSVDKTGNIEIITKSEPDVHNVSEQPKSK